MSKIKIYDPVIKEGKSYFRVNGACDPDRNNAISKASKHSSITSGKGEIVRLDESEVDAEDWYNPKNY